MRIYIACVLLMIAPVLGLIAWKQYEFLQADRQLQPQWHQRGEVLFFNATWCPPCRHMKPIVASLKREGYRMRDLNVDSHRDLAQKYGVSAVPTFVFLENGAEVNRFSGGTSAEHLRSLCSDGSYR